MQFVMLTAHILTPTIFWTQKKSKVTQYISKFNISWLVLLVQQLIYCTEKAVCIELQVQRQLMKLRKVSFYKVV